MEIDAECYSTWSKKSEFFFITEIDTECHETSLDTIIREIFVLEVGQK